MIVCHCKASTDRDIRSAQRCGARTCDQIAACLEAGSVCGDCVPLIEQILENKPLPGAPRKRRKPAAA